MALWCARAVLSGIIVFFFTYGALRSSITDSTGHNPDLWFAGSLMFVSVLLVA